MWLLLDLSFQFIRIAYSSIRIFSTCVLLLLLLPLLLIQFKHYCCQMHSTLISSQSDWNSLFIYILRIYVQSVKIITLHYRCKATERKKPIVCWFWFSSLWFKKLWINKIFFEMKFSLLLCYKRNHVFCMWMEFFSCGSRHVVVDLK